MKNLLWIPAVLAAATAQAIVIDDFTVPYSNSISSSSWVDVQGGAFLTGERDVQIIALANPNGQFLDLDIPSTGIMVVDNGFETVGRVSLQYDGPGDEAGNTGSGLTLTNGGTGTSILPGANDRIRVRFLGNDLDVKVTVTARLSGGTLGTASAVRIANSGVGDLDVFVAPAVLAAMDSLTIDFEGVPSADFAVGRIEAVPEPATMLALALGTGALALRRRVREWS